MRTREQQSPDLGVFEKTKFDQFTAGKKIVVNIDGDWKEVTLREEVTKDDVKNGKLNLKISYEKTPGNSVDLDLPVEAEPKIVKYPNGLNIQDADYGDFTIETSYVTENGSIEYNVKDNDENKTEVGVRQEIIDLWRSVNEAKQNVATLEAKIGRLSAQKRLEFTTELHKANKFVTEIFASLPEINKMNKLDNDQLTALQEKLAGLMKKSEQVLKSLSADVDLVINNTGATPAPPARARRFEDFRHDDTEKDKAVREKELTKDAKNAEAMKEELEQKIAEAYEEIDDEREGVLVDRRKTEEEAFMSAHADANGKLPKGSKGFDKDKVKLTPAEEKEFKNKKAKAKKEIYKNFFERSGRRSELQKKILDEVTRLRMEAVQIDSTTEDSQLRKDNGVVVDYVKPAASSDDYLDSVYLAKNIKILDQVLKNIIDKKELGEETAENKEVFDFSSEVEKSKTRMQAMLESIPKKDDGTPEDSFVSVYKALQKRLADFDKDSTSLSNRDLAVREGLLQANDSKDVLQRNRFDLVSDNNRELDGDARDIQKIKAEEEIKNISKETENSIQEKTPVIDMTEPMMQEILKSNFLVVEDALTSMLTEGLDYTDVNGVTALKPKILEKFKNLISENSPNPALLAKLREAGIKNWADFKKLWDEKLAGQAAASVDKMLQAVMKKEIANNISWWDKTKKFKGQIAARMAITTALVGGAAVGASLGVAALGGAAAIGVAAGGTVGGGIRGALNKLLFGNKRMQARSERLQKELEDSKKGDVVKNIVGKVLGSLDSTIVASSNIKELPSFSAILAQTTRDLTTEMSQLSEVAEVTEAKDLQGNARVLYERALAHLEIKEEDVENKRKLAQIIFKMNGKGDSKAELLSKDDPKIMRLLESVVSIYSGKTGIVASAAMGGIVSLAYLADSEITRASMGALFGGIKGYKEGRARQVESQQAKARGSIYTDISDLRAVNQTAFRDPSYSIDSLSAENRKVLRDKVIRLKRLVHINAEPADLAVFGIVKKDEKGNYVDYNANVIIDKDGKLVDAEARMLFMDMRSAITDAERIGLLHERQEDRKNMGVVLEQLQARSKEIEEGLPKERKGLMRTFGNWLANKTYRNKTFTYTVGGAVLGAASALLIGAAAKEIKEGIFGTPAGGMNPDNLGGKGANALGEKAGVGAAAVAKAGENGGAIAGLDNNHAGTASNTGELPAESPNNHEGLLNPEVESKPQIFSLKVGKGGSAWGTLDRTLTDKGAPAEFKDLFASDKKAFAAWREQQLEDMGYKKVNGHMGHPVTIHEGAEMKVYKGEDGNWHARFDDSVTAKSADGRVYNTVESNKTLHFQAPETKSSAEDWQNNYKFFNKVQPAVESGDAKVLHSLVTDTKLGPVIKEMGGIPSIREVTFDPKSGEVALSMYNPQTHEDLILPVHPHETDNGWQMLDVDRGLKPNPYTEVMHPANDNTAWTVSDKPANPVFFDEKEVANHHAQPNVEVTNNATNHEAANDNQFADHSSKTGDAKDVDVLSGSENTELAQEYKDQIEELVGEINPDIHDGGTGLVLSVRDKLLHEIGAANDNQLPADLKHELATNPDAAKEYLLKKLDPDEKLLFEDVGQGTTKLEGASDVLIGEDGLAVKMQLEDGSEYIFHPPKGWKQFDDVDGVLYLKNGDLHSPVEIHNEEGVYHIRPLDQAGNGKIAKAA
ncbi:MAG: hypothetical protein PHQ18_02340 [Patescibacteria group bacterium]|nr:hypothetical protein [Patescibacteria group bacterium]